MIGEFFDIKTGLQIHLLFISRSSMPDDKLALGKFYLPIQQGMATEQHANAKFPFLLF